MQRIVIVPKSRKRKRTQPSFTPLSNLKSKMHAFHNTTLLTPTLFPTHSYPTAKKYLNHPGQARPGPLIVISYAQVFHFCSFTPNNPTRPSLSLSLLSFRLIRFSSLPWAVPTTFFLNFQTKLVVKAQACWASS